MAANVSANGKTAIGIDLGGTKIEIAIVDSEGSVRKRIRQPTAVARGYTFIKDNIAAVVRQMLAETDLRPCGVGIGIAGQVEPETGVVLFGPNLNWKNEPLRSDLSESLNLPVAITNDVRAACWGEWLYGAGRGLSNLVAVFVGTGIGGGVVADGRILNGCTNTLGEIGHIPVELNGPECRCGGHGCLESIAGGWAIAQHAQEAIESTPDEGEVLLRLAGGRREAITAMLVIQALEQDDSLARKIMGPAIEALVSASVGIVNAFNPCMLILGGGIVDGYPKLIELVDEGVRRRALKAATRLLVVTKAQLGKDSGVIGSAAMALNSFSGES